MMLQKKIIKRTARIGVIGLGYVGLPLAVLCGQKGYQVTGIDCDGAKVESLRRGVSYITGVANRQIQSLLAAKMLQVTNNYEGVPGFDIILICVPTPLREDFRPDYSHLFAAVEAIAAKLTPQQMIIVESTVIPGTTTDEILPRLAAGDLKVGQDFYLVFSPERIDPANELYGLQNIPKLVAGVTSDCLVLAKEFYAQLEINTVPVSTPNVAEMAKLLENTYRYVNIALINEMSEVCHEMGIDIFEVIAAASTKPFGFEPFYPGPGVGGHCLPKDSMYYIYLSRQKGIPARLAEQARRINTLRPEYVVRRLKEALADQGKALVGSKILILGVTYKKDVNDIRESPALKIIELLADEGSIVSFHDPFIEKVQIRDLVMARLNFEKDSIIQQDCIVLAVPHTYYNLSWLNATCPFIFDLTNAMAPFGQKGSKIIQL